MAVVSTAVVPMIVKIGAMAFQSKHDCARDLAACRGTCRARLLPWRSVMALADRSTGGCMTTTNHETAEVHAGQALPTASDIRDIIERKKKDKLAEEVRFRKAAEEKLAEQKKAFDVRKLTPELIDRVMSRVRRAAENGEYDVLVGRFPSEWCSDGGRSINVREEGWHETLPSFAREFFEFWQ